MIGTDYTCSCESNWTTCGYDHDHDFDGLEGKIKLVLHVCI